MIDLTNQNARASMWSNTTQFNLMRQHQIGLSRIVGVGDDVCNSYLLTSIQMGQVARFAAWFFHFEGLCYG